MTNGSDTLEIEGEYVKLNYAIKSGIVTLQTQTITEENRFKLKTIYLAVHKKQRWQVSKYYYDKMKG